MSTKTSTRESSESPRIDGREVHRSLELRADVVIVGSGPAGSACGAGHCSGPAVTPGGSVHASVVGRPESPGLRQ